MNNNFKKLHLGAFDQVNPGWINTDITPHVFVSKIPGLAFLLFKAGLISQQRYEQHKNGVFQNINYLNVTKQFPYTDNAFDYVFSSHLFEHLYPTDAIFCLKEVYRVLKVGGVLRISVPDLDKIIASYDPTRTDEFLEAIFESKRKRDKNKHHWHFNERSLSTILKVISFREVYRCEFKQGRCADVALIDNRPDSLFIEAVK